MATRQKQSTKLSDTQLVLLSAASQRQDRSLLPTETITDRAFARAVNGLVKFGFVAHVEPDLNQPDEHTSGANVSAFVITTAGYAAIGLELAPDADDRQATPQADQSDVLPLTDQPASPEKRQTKKALIISMLSRSQGASLDELIGATGWLPHTTRAALTGLRQKGFGVERTSSEGRSSIYRITGATTQERAA